MRSTRQPRHSTQQPRHSTQQPRHSTQQLRLSTQQLRLSTQRTPLTITLSREDLAFIESCVSLKAFDSVDQLFAAALAHYKRYVRAVNAYAEDQAHKGLTRAEILASIECETVVTKLVEPDRRG